MRAARSWVPALLLLALLFGGASCGKERASPELCARILDRIVELELGERGYRDPVLMQRKKTELRSRFSEDLRRCQGRAVRPGALECVQRAKHTEELSHRCVQ